MTTASPSRAAPAASRHKRRSICLSRPISFGGTSRVELFVDVLNALNDTAEEGIATDNLFSPNFGVPTAFVDPRRAMIGIRLNLGR